MEIEILQSPNVSEAEHHYSIAHEYFLSKKYGECLEHLDKAIDLAEDNLVTKVYAMLSKGRVFFLKGKHTEVIALCEQSIDLINNVDNPSNELVKQKAIAYKHIGELFAEQKKYEEALAMQQKAIQTCNMDSFRASCYKEIGDLYLKQHSIDQAVVSYQKAIELHTSSTYSPKNEVKIAACYHTLGMALHLNSDHEKALQAYNKALELCPTSFNYLKSNVHFSIACTYRNQEKPTLAQAHYQKAIENHIPRPSALISQSYIEIGLIYAKQKKWKKAIAAYQEGAHFSPAEDLEKKASFDVGIASVYQKLNDHKKAITHYLKALDVYQKEENKSVIGSICGELAQLYLQQDDFAKASHYLEKHLSTATLEPSVAIISYLFLGHLYEKHEKDLPSAVRAYQNALAHIKNKKKYDSGTAMLHYDIAKIYQQMNEKEKAIKAFQDAFKAYPTTDYKKRGDCMLRIGNIYQKEKNRDIAYSHYKKALTIYNKEKENCEEGLVLAYLNLAFIKPLKEKKYTKYYFLKAAELTPAVFPNEKATIYASLADRLYVQDRKKDALAYYLKALELHTEEVLKESLELFAKIFLVAKEVSDKQGMRTAVEAAQKNIEGCTDVQSVATRFVEKYEEIAAGK